jgi:alkylation response protein AidB-like acyl-CoA dehydrogenase
MQYTHEHREIQNTLKRFIEAEINPHVDEWEAAEIFPVHEVFKKMGNLGLLGLTKPEAFGGAGLDYSYGMAMAEALGHIDCGGIPMAIGVQTDMATPALARFGSDELRAQFLAPAIAGDMVGCIGVSEPSAGSDVAGIKRVPQRYRIGAEGQGFIYQMQQFQEERLWCAASTLQSLTNCIQWTVEWAQERKLFGSTLADQQWVQFKLAELKAEVESLRALTYQSCEHYIAGEDVTEWATMAKLKAGRLNRTVPDTCLQFWGGMGFTWENKVSRMYRDGRLASIGGGADEVMLGILSKMMGIAKRPQK